jgi:hypothetical protein
MAVPELSALPGGDLVMAGLRDLERGAAGTVAALLVRIGRNRLVHTGIEVPPCPQEQDAELQLYERLVADGTPDPYGRYNALIRRLISCEAALELAQGAEIRAAARQ